MEKLHQKKEKTLRAAWLISLWAPLGTGVALYFGQTTVLLADFLRRNSELLGLFLAWLAYKRVLKGPDNRFNFGAEKLEDMASLTVGIIMTGSSLIISFSAIQSFFNPQIPGWLVPGLFIAGGGVLVNGWFWFRFRGLNKQETTPIFTAQGGLYRAKTLIDCVVLITLIGLTLGWEWSVYIDPVGSLIIALFLLFTGINTSRISFWQLLDRAPKQEVITEIKGALEKHCEIKKLKARSAGQKIFLEVELDFPGEKTLDNFGEKAFFVKEKLESKWPNLKVSILPVQDEPKKKFKDKNN